MAITLLYLTTYRYKLAMLLVVANSSYSISYSRSILGMLLLSSSFILFIYPSTNSIRLVFEA